MQQEDERDDVVRGDYELKEASHAYEVYYDYGIEGEYGEGEVIHEDSDLFNDDDEMSSKASTSTTAASTTTPKGPTSKTLWSEARYYAFPFTIWIILFNEFCERFSFYVQRAILTLYLQNGLKIEGDTAISAYNALIALVYTLPLVGAILSDSYLGPYNTIASFSVVYVIGAGMLAATTNPPKLWGALTGLGLISIGSGGIKPCVAMFGAEQINHKLTITSESSEQDKITKERITSNYFSVFYLSINVSSTFSYIFAPMIRTRFGYGAAFALPAICLAISTLVFICGRAFFYIPQLKKKEVIILKPVKVIYITVVHFFATKLGFSKASNNHVELFDESEGTEGNAGASINNETGRAVGYFQPATTRFGQKAVSDTIALLEISLVFLFIVMFYALIDQQGSAWTIQAENMDLHVFGIDIEPEQPQAINPFLLSIYIPFLNVVMYPLLRRWNIEVSTMKRLQLGLNICLLGFIPGLLVDIAINRSSEKISVLWQIPQLALTTFGEAFVGPAGYCLAWTWAPPEYKSLAASLLLMAIALGNVTISLVYFIFGKILSQTGVFYIFIGLSVANNIVFYFLTRKFASKEAELLKNPISEATVAEETEMKEIS